MPLGWDLLDWGLNAPQWGNHKDWEGSTLRPPSVPDSQGVRLQVIRARQRRRPRFPSKNPGWICAFGLERFATPPNLHRAGGGDGGGHPLFVNADKQQPRRGGELPTQVGCGRH